MTRGWLLRFMQVVLLCFTANAEISEWQEKIKTYLYTADNPQYAHELQFGKESNVRESKLNPNEQTKVIIHGWNCDWQENWVRDFRDNYFKVGNYNIIVFDWGSTAFKINYFDVVHETHQFGRYLGEILEILRIEKNLSLSKVHIIGHSLGAHMAGGAGHFLKGNIGRITGLDPAAVVLEHTFWTRLFRMFTNGVPYKLLNSSDAIFVDVIHTCDEFLGFSQKIGSVDFYPYEGLCDQNCNDMKKCNHAKAYEYMIDSIIHKNGFIAVKCGSWQDYDEGTCGENGITIMGEYANPTIRGSYYLETNINAPYGRGAPEDCSQPSSKNYYSTCG